MPDLAENLEQLGQELNITGVPARAEPGQHILASLTPDLSQLTLTNVIEHDVDLELIAKQVVFTNTDITDSAFPGDSSIVKVLPMFDLTSVPPSLDDSGVPGLIGTLTGKLPVAVSAPLSITVSWKVQDGSGNNLVEGSDFLAPDGLEQQTLSIIFLPAFELFDGTTPQDAVRQLLADVTLKSGSETWSGEIGPVRVVVPAIPFPQVLALTRHSDFDGAALIVVPGSSAISTINEIKTLLQPIRTVIGTLTSIARFAEMLTGIDMMTEILDATNIVFRKEDRINNLNNIDLIKRPWYRNDIEAEDELSSLAYLSPPPLEGSARKVELCNDRDLKAGQGKFTVSTGSAFVALCRSLHSKTPELITPSGDLTVNEEPSGWRVRSPFSGISSFGNELSSLRFL